LFRDLRDIVGKSSCCYGRARTRHQVLVVVEIDHGQKRAAERFTGLKQMMQVFEQTQCSVIATLMIDGPAISSYGVLKVKPADGRFNGRLYEIVDLVEKPSPEKAPSNLAVIGRYILTPGIFEALEHTPLGTGGELQLTDGIRLLLKKEKVYGYCFEGKRYDTGDKTGFLKATVEFALKRPDLGADLRDWLKTLKL